MGRKVSGHPTWVQKKVTLRERGWFRCVKIMNEIEAVVSASPAASNARKLYPRENDDGEDTVVAMRCLPRPPR